MPATVSIIEGDRQTAQVATQLPTAIRVRILDAESRAVSGQLVNFVVVAGGGSVFAGSAQTNAAGEALERWTLGTAAGAQALEVRAVDQTTGDPIVFGRAEATATAGPAATLTLRKTDTLALLNVATDLRALISSVTDAYGNPIPNAPLSVGGPGTWTASNGVLTPNVEGDWGLTLSASAATATLTLRARRDVRPIAGWTATWGCRNGVGRMLPEELYRRHGIIDWVLLEYDATARIDSVRYGFTANGIPRDAVLWLSADVIGRFRAHQGVVEDTLTLRMRGHHFAFWQQPDTLLFRNQSSLPISSAQLVGGSYQGADWCYATEHQFLVGYYRGTNGLPATEGSFVPLALRP